jgi:glutamine amidotransferase
MQVLYETGEEHGVETSGIGVLPGRVERLDAPILPHMGWNTVVPTEGSPLFAGVEQERFYFVHSFAARPGGSGETLATHGASTFVAAVERGELAATQFHPEKSGDAGLQLLSNWVATLR